MGRNIALIFIIGLKLFLHRKIKVKMNRIKKHCVEYYQNLPVVGCGATTTIYRDGDKAIKLYLNAPHDEAENESKRQQFAYDSGLPVPKVYGVHSIDSNAVILEMEYINGIPLSHPQMDKNERLQAIKSLVELQCMVHKIIAAGQPKQVEKYGERIKKSNDIDDHDKNELLKLLSNLDTDAECLCHGDFHPLNVLFNGNKHWIIDWVDATSGNPLADACRTYLIFKQFMTRSAGIFLRLFCKESKVLKDDVLKWLPIIAASRLSENVDYKTKAWLLEMIKNH